jgi:tetratricopeptide (TPR) repeat protein
MRDDGNGSAAIMHHPAGDVPTEDARLDDAIRRADELLVSSLKSEEQHRSRQRRTFTLTLVGGLIMIAAVCVILGVLLQAGGGGAQAASNASPEQLTQEGWQLWQQRKLTEAEAKFEQALKADPKQTAAWNGLGWAQLNQGKNDKAEKAFQEVVKLEPEHPAALNGLGWINYNKKKFDAAEKYFLQAAANNASASYSGLAQMYLLQGKYDQALPWALLLTQQQGADVAMAGKLVEAAKTKKLDAVLKKQIEPAEGGSTKS